MRFRWQRGSLEESMSTSVEFDGGKELFSIVRKTFPFGEIFVEKYGWDERCGWDCWLVLVDGNAVGFTSGPVERWS
jgi:hypothetical protein